MSEAALEGKERTLLVDRLASVQISWTLFQWPMPTALFPHSRADSIHPWTGHWRCCHNAAMPEVGCWDFQPSSEHTSKLFCELRGIWMTCRIFNGRLQNYEDADSI